MNSTLLYLVTLVIHMLPSTRLWGMKRALYRFCGVAIHDRVRICSNVTITGHAHLNIGDNTWIGHETFISASDNIHIGSNVNIAPRVYIGTGTHIIDINGASIAGLGCSMPITIGDGSWLCTGSIILPGVNIGKKSIIAAGAVVIGDIPDGQLWGGVPAKFIKKLY